MLRRCLCKTGQPHSKCGLNASKKSLSGWRYAHSFFLVPLRAAAVNANSNIAICLSLHVHYWGERKVLIHFWNLHLCLAQLNFSATLKRFALATYMTCFAMPFTSKFAIVESPPPPPTHSLACSTCTWAKVPLIYWCLNSSAVHAFPPFLPSLGNTHIYAVYTASHIRSCWAVEQSSVNIPARFGERLAEIVRQSAILGWAAGHF